MSKRLALTVIVLACGVAVAQAQGPANVIMDLGCSFGYIGCPVADAIPHPDGGLTCPANAIQFAGFTGREPIKVTPNDAHGNSFLVCRGDLDFGGPNPTGTDGQGGDFIALRLSTACAIVPSVCQGNGSAVVNDRTFPGITCNVLLPDGSVVPTTNTQSVITRSGEVTLTCFLPDPPQGE